MKKQIILFVMLFAGLTLMAKPVDPDRAVRVARNFVAQYVKGADQMAAAVVYTHPMQGERSKVKGENGDRPAMYVVNVGNMFVIVAADDIAHPVLGYSLSRPWPVQKENGKMKNENEKRSSFITQHSSLPPQVAGFLDDLAGQIAAGVEAGNAPDPETAAEWQQLLTVNSQLSIVNLPDSVGPLLTTTWDQGQYYNSLCPADTNGPDGHALTGCVATAMAQIINYWGYPIHGRGTHSYDQETNLFYGRHIVIFDSANYDFANMPNQLTTSSSPAQVNAVAQLMYHCGVAANMEYGPIESGAYNYDARAGMINFFRMSPNASYAERAEFNNSEWENLLQSNIASSQPVYYIGYGGHVGHSFVCDGYNSDGYLHFNFGWGGLSDGWYRNTSINPSVYNFNSHQAAIVGISPDSTGDVIIVVS